jgi:bifunctional ADP-heptose synthase (sugar kinase/adenylyltransferase)
MSNININDVFFAADSQSSSQHGDIGRFKNMSLISATEKEVRLSLKNYEDGLVFISDKIQDQTKSKYLLLKLGADGVIINDKSQNSEKWKTDKIDALNENPKDVAGAGDSMLIVTSMALATGSVIWEAALLGSYAAAIQVSRIGNNPITKDDLLKELL